MTKKSKKVWTYKLNEKGKFVKDKETDLGAEWDEDEEESVIHSSRF